ncbi:MAG: 5-formyltetrahydrofolate cyclo-ligase [Candidatus Peribacteraceae bacterium]
MPTKAEVRLAIRERLRKLPDKDRAMESQVICRQLHKIIGDGSTSIGVYMPFLDEPDIRPLMNEFLKEGRIVCVPSVPSMGKKLMVFKQIKALNDVRRDPVTGIPQPREGMLLENEASIGMVIVPGRAFTAACDRLGRGGGGYDHWIHLQRRRNPVTKYIGVCFECQMLQEIPTEPHDEQVDIVITSGKVWRKAN